VVGPGRKVFGTGWHYDATAPGHKRVAWGNNWVVVGALVRLPFVAHRQVCLPVLARPWQPHLGGLSQYPCAGAGDPCPTGRGFIGDYFALAISNANIYALIGLDPLPLERDG
jgi:hypothetical protein